MIQRLGCNAFSCRGSKPMQRLLLFQFQPLSHLLHWMETFVFKAGQRISLHNERESFKFHVACLGEPLGSGLVGPRR